MKKISTIFLLSATAILSFNGQLKTVDALSNTDALNELLAKYVDETATYTKETKIYLNDDACHELLVNGGFHANVSTLERTTYYKGDALWMSRGKGEYSYYGTAYNEGTPVGVTNATATTPLVHPENAPVVLSGEGKNSMQEYYIGLEDIIAKEGHNWTLDNDVYSTTDSEVIEWFKNFTAPCYLGFTNEDTSNYIALNKATIHRDNSYNLVLNLYATTDTDKFTSVGGLFSSATILYDAPDFRDDFTLETANGQWKYGTVDYDWGTNDFNFTTFDDSNKNENGDGWKKDNVEVKAGWINAGSMMAIGYTFDETSNINVVVDANVGTDISRLALRIRVRNSEGLLKDIATFDVFSKDIKQVSKNIAFDAGDTVYFLVSNEEWENGEAYPNAEFNITLNPIKLLADFRKDFSLDTANGQWKYGTVGYDWNTNDFSFTTFEPSEKNAGNDGWQKGGAEVKAGWINAGEMMAIAYTFTEATNLDATFKAKVGTNETQLALRIRARNSEGTLTDLTTFDVLSKDNTQISKELSFNAGDTVYFIISNEAWQNGDAYPNAEFDITFTER